MGMTQGWEPQHVPAPSQTHINGHRDALSKAVCISVIQSCSEDSWHLEAPHCRDLSNCPRALPHSMIVSEYPPTPQLQGHESPSCR